MVRQTDTKTRVTTIHFASATPHVKRNNKMQHDMLVNQKMPTNITDISTTRMWANAQRDGRTAKYRWDPLFNAVNFG